MAKSGDKTALHNHRMFKLESQGQTLLRLKHKRHKMARYSDNLAKNILTFGRFCELHLEPLVRTISSLCNLCHLLTYENMDFR